MTTNTASIAEELDAVTVDLIFALRDSIDPDQVSFLDFWSSRVGSALEAAAAGASTASEAATIACRKLQIDTVATPSAPGVVAFVEAVNRVGFEAWAAHIARNSIYVVALANTVREDRKEEKKAAAAAKRTAKETIHPAGQGALLIEETN